MKNFFLHARFLVLLFISGFIFSCENPNEIGFDFTGDFNSQTIFTDTISLDVSTILADSAVNNYGNYILAGHATDPIFGKSSAEAYFQPTLANITATIVDTFKVASNAVADSVQLRIVNTGLMFGDTIFKSQFGIYRLTQSMNTGKNYNGDQKLAYDPTPLAKFTLTSAAFKGPNYDTLMAYYVNLPISIAEELIAIGKTPRVSSSEFIGLFKGFAIVPDANARAVYSFNTGALGSNNCWFSVYWHNEGDTTSRSYLFELNGPRHTGFEFSRSATALANLSKNNNEVKTNPFTYVQAGSGVQTKIDLNKISNLGSNLKIASAQLIFELDKTSINSAFPKLFNYTLAEIDSRNQQLRTSSNLAAYITGTTQSGVGTMFTLVDSTNTLTTDITYYLQNKFNKSQKPGSIALLPSIPTTTSGFGIVSNDHLRRAVFTKPKLKLYYTKSK